MGVADVHYIGGSDTLPPPLTREREAELLNRIEEEDSKRELIEHNLRLVAHIIKKGYPSRKLFLAGYGRNEV